MGLFFSSIAVQDTSLKSLEKALRGVAKNKGLRLQEAKDLEREPNSIEIAVSSQGKGTISYGLEPSISLPVWEAADALSGLLKEPVLVLYIHDSDYWMYQIIAQGEEITRFHTCPDEVDGGDGEAKARWRGDARKLCELWQGLSPERIENYLVPWETQKREKACPDDRYTYHEALQLFDFMRRLGIPEPHSSESGLERRNFLLMRKGQKRAKKEFTELHRAALANDAGKIEELIRGGADISAEDLANRSPLDSAADSGQTEAVRTLLKYKSMIRKPLGSALQLAILSTDVVGILLDAGADPNALQLNRLLPGPESRHGEEYEVPFETFELLVSGGLSLDRRDDGGWLPIHHAANGEAWPAFDLFLERGSPCPVECAAARGDIEKMRKELGDRPIDAETIDLLVKWAAKGGSVEALRYVGQGAGCGRISQGCLDGALCDACRRGHLEAAEWLLDRGANPSVLVDGWFTPLLASVRSGNKDLVELLLQHGADSDGGAKPPRADAVPLCEAVESFKIEMVRALLEHGANPDIQDCNQMSAKNWAEFICDSGEETALEIRRLISKSEK